MFLDFINTYDDPGKTRDEDALPNWKTALKWSKNAGLLDNREYNALLALSETTSVSKEMETLYRLRELGWKFFNNIAAKKPPDATDLTAVEEFIKWSFQHATMQKERMCYSWVVQTSILEPTILRVKLGLALSSLLSTENLDRVNECPGCTGIFLNHGRGVGRRWCRMKTCGNRAKTNRFRGA